MNLRAAPALAMLIAGPAWAGPPYITDDPEPTRTGGWENYLYSSGENTPGATAGQGGLELNYGAAPNVQLTLDLPADYAATRGLKAGPGDIGISAKYRFLHPASEFLPDAAIFPAITVPTGAHDFTSGHLQLFIPLWLERDFGPWSLFGGGGYTLNPGARQKNNALTGLALTRTIRTGLNLGLEITHQTSTASGAPAQTNLGFGAIVQVAKHWALMASGGPSLTQSGGSNFYVALQFTN